MAGPSSTSVYPKPHETRTGTRPAAEINYGELLDAATDCIVGIDWNYNFIFANRPACDLLGTPNLIGQNMWELFPGNLEEPFHSSYRATMERRVETRFEAFYAAPLNRWFQVTVRPLSCGIGIFFNDIGERKSIEVRRDEAARQLQQVFDVTSDAIISLNRDWRYTFLNRRAREDLAFKGDLIGRNVWEEFPATAGPESDFSINFRRAMEERVVCAFEAFYPAPLNRYYSVEARPSDEGIVLFSRDVTERRVAELAIHDQQELLHIVQGAARMATWDLDPETGNLSYGAGSYPVFGHPFERVATMKALDRVISPAHRACVREAIQTVISTRSMLTLDFQVIAEDGTPLWIEARGQSIGFPGGRARVGGMAIDITGRKSSMVALAASEERYRILADLNPQAIWMGAPDGSITYANQSFLDYLGHTQAELDEQVWLNTFAPEDRHRVRDSWSRSVATGEEYNIEASILRGSDGAARVWWLRALPVRDEAGAILHWLGVAMDVHEAKSSAEALHRKQQETERQRAELETIYQTADIGLALLSPDDFRFLRINERQAEILGLAPEHIIGHCIAEIVPDIPELLDIFRKVAAGTSIRDLTVEGELPARPGERRVWTVNYTPVYDEDGTITAITAASLEITQQKKAEAALIQSEKLAAVGRLATSISHEINNPLEAITNLLYLMATSGDLSDESRLYVNMAQSELSRVSQIATQTLRFHRQAVRPTSVTAAELVNAVLNLYQGRLSNSGIKVETCYATSQPILCFENDIRQVLNNLIANGIDAMRTGGRLIARAHNAFDPVTGDRGVRITIADTGHGMSAATRARVFEPFYTTKDLNGTGLGLWISAGIVQRHQGRLTVKSSEHLVHPGTVFALFLPLDQTFSAGPAQHSPGLGEVNVAH